MADGAGGFQRSAGRRWARCGPRSRAGTGREAEAAGLSVSTVPYRITVRAAPAGCAVAAAGRGSGFATGRGVFRILAVTEADAAARYLTCIAREEVVT